MDISTNQKRAPKERTRFDVLLCEQLDIWKNTFYLKYQDLFEHQGRSVHHVVNTKFKYSLCPIQEKGRRISIHVQEKVEKENNKLLLEGHIQRLDKRTSDCFIALLIFPVKTKRFH